MADTQIIYDCFKRRKKQQNYTQTKNRILINIELLFK